MRSTKGTASKTHITNLLADMHSFNLTGVDSETYGDLVNALRNAIDLYEIRGWTRRATVRIQLIISKIIIGLKGCLNK